MSRVVEEVNLLMAVSLHFDCEAMSTKFIASAQGYKIVRSFSAKITLPTLDLLCTF